MRPAPVVQSGPVIDLPPSGLEGPGFMPPDLAPPDFAPWSSAHLLALALSLGSLVAILGSLRLLRSPNAHRRIRLALAGLATVFVAFSWGYWLLFMPWDWQRSLPLQACDWAGVFAPLALFTRARVFRAALFYWSIAFTLQAFAQPVVERGPASAVYWAFWTSHWAIIACATWDFWGEGFRPRWRDGALALLCAYAWLGVVFPLNIVLGSNYGYVGNAAPRVASVIDHLGPWPGRALILIAIGHVVFAVLTLLGARVPGGENGPGACVPLDEPR